MAYLQRRWHTFDARRVHAIEVAVNGRAPRLVMGDPVFDPVAQTLGDDVGIFDKRSDGVAAGPAAGVLQVLRQVPVIQRHPGHHAARQHAVDQARIKFQTFLVRRGAARTENARPGNRKAVGVQAERLAQLHVLGPAAKMVAGDCAVGAVANCAGLFAEGVPNRRHPSPIGRPAFDLERRRRASPYKIVAKIGAGQ